MRDPGPRRILVDGTHLRGRVTGIERIALDLFSPEALAPHRIERIASGSLAAMLAEQQVGLPARALSDRDALLICPGYPPSWLAVAALGRRCITYVHDTFLLTRPEDLSWKARAYMRPCFAFAARRGREFLANSETTARDFRRFAHPDARIELLRPPVRDVFGLAGLAREPRRAEEPLPSVRDVFGLRDLPGPADYRPGKPLRILAIGTIEPRKAYGDAVAIVAQLNAIGVPARLDIVGRVGWGEHTFLADPPPFLRLHHDLDDAGVRGLVARSDALLCTSKAEGLGLPLLEVQHGGLPVVAPRGEVFEEVLAGSGLHVATAETDAAALAIRDWIAPGGAFGRAAEASRRNVARWAELAAGDRARFLCRIASGEI